MNSEKAKHVEETVECDLHHYTVALDLYYNGLESSTPYDLQERQASTTASDMLQYHSMDPIQGVMALDDMIDGQYSSKNIHGNNEKQ